MLTTDTVRALLQCSSNQEASNYILQHLRLREYRINNVSSSGHLGFKVDINRLSLDVDLMEYVTYEPERFPGAIYKLTTNNTVLSVTVFHSGSVTLTGAKSCNDIYDGFEKLWRILRKFAIFTPTTNQPVLKPEDIETYRYESITVPTHDIESIV